MPHGDWLKEEEQYLDDLSRLCEELSARYKMSFEKYKVIQARFRIPSIIISSVTGLTSFGSSNFPEEYRDWVSISVGIASLSIAILSSIESYMKIGEHLAGASQASVELHKLKEYIDMEIALPGDQRTTQGIIFIRDCYVRYERILDIAPDLLMVLRFIKPSRHAPIDRDATKAVERCDDETMSKCWPWSALAASMRSLYARSSSKE